MDDLDSSAIAAWLAEAVDPSYAAVAGWEHPCRGWFEACRYGTGRMPA